MQLTLRSNHAMRLMMFCALNPGRLAPVSEIARACNMSPSHLAKIAAALAARGFVETARGRRGGVRLARPAAALNLGEIVRATEIGGCLVECLDPVANTCPLVSACRFRGIVAEALEAFLRVLDRYSLADLTDGREAALRRVMGLPEILPETIPDGAEARMAVAPP